MIYTMKNKYIIRSRIAERKFRSILLYVSTYLTLIALQEVWILKPLKLQKSLIFQRLLYGEFSNKLES